MENSISPHHLGRPFPVLKHFDDGNSLRTWHHLVKDTADGHEPDAAEDEQTQHREPVQDLTRALTPSPVHCDVISGHMLGP